MATATPSAVGSSTVAATPSAQATQYPNTEIPTEVPRARCPGDCNDDRRVSVSELIRGVKIALGQSPLSDCTVFDRDGSDSVSIAELVSAVSAALRGCDSFAGPRAREVPI